MTNKRIKNAIKNYNKGLRMMSSAKNTLMNGGMIYQVGGTMNTVQPQRQANVNNMVSSLQNINRTFLPNNILGNNNVQSVLQERPSLYQGGGWKNIAAAYFGNNVNGISYRNSPLHAYNQGLRQGKQFQIGGQKTITPEQRSEYLDKKQMTDKERLAARKQYWTPKKLENLVTIYKGHPLTKTIDNYYQNEERLGRNNPLTIGGLPQIALKYYDDIMSNESLWLDAYNDATKRGFDGSLDLGTHFYLPLKQSTDGQKIRQKKQYQMGGEIPQQEEQFVDESEQYMNELAGQTPGQQNIPEQEGMEQQLSQEEMMQLAQLILQGDEEALKLAEQLPEEQQQMLMQIIEQMQQQGNQNQQQPQTPQPSEEEMMMQQQAMQGQEMPMMMVGGIKKKKRKSVTKSSYYSHGGAMKKGVNKSLYQMLGIPC